MQPDIVVEKALGAHLFIGETDAGREWLTRWFPASEWEWLGRFLSVEDEGDARDLIDAAVADGLEVTE